MILTGLMPLPERSAVPSLRRRRRSLLPLTAGQKRAAGKVAFPPVQVLPQQAMASSPKKKVKQRPRHLPYRRKHSASEWARRRRQRQAGLGRPPTRQPARSQPRISWRGDGTETGSASFWLRRQRGAPTSPHLVCCSGWFPQGLTGQKILTLNALTIAPVLLVETVVLVMPLVILWLSCAYPQGFFKTCWRAARSLGCTQLHCLRRGRQLYWGTYGRAGNCRGRSPRAYPSSRA